MRALYAAVVASALCLALAGSAQADPPGHRGWHHGRTHHGWHHGFSRPAPGWGGVTYVVPVYVPPPVYVPEVYGYSYEYPYGYYPLSSYYYPSGW